MMWWPDVLWMALGLAVILYFGNLYDWPFFWLILVWIVGIVYTTIILAFIFDYIGLWLFFGPVLLFLAWVFFRQKE